MSLDPAIAARLKRDANGLFSAVAQERSTGQVLKDAAHKTPVLNDPAFRTAGILTAGGIMGYKASRTIQASGGLLHGGLSGLGKGTIIGGAVVGGLLGAQLLGGLDFLDG